MFSPSSSRTWALGKKEDGNVAVLALVASVKDTANGGHDGEDGVDKV